MHYEIEFPLGALSTDVVEAALIEAGRPLDHLVRSRR